MSEIADKKSYFTYRDVMLFKDQIIDTWHPQSDVWAFKFGDEILGCLCAFGSILITYIFRKELKLRPYARLTCYVPVVGISATACCMFHSIVISADILRSNRCPLCVSTKAGISQVMFGIGYPLIATSTICFFMADRLLTYPVPPIAKAPREVFNLFQKIIRKNPRPYLVLGAMHIIAASFISFQKQKTLLYLELKTRRS